MPLTTIQEMFKTPWGIVENCRQEIESSGAGGFDRILKREIEDQFPSARKVAVLMGCCESTARKWMREHDARCIEIDGSMRYLAEDVKRIDKVRRNSKVKPA